MTCTRTKTVVLLWAVIFLAWASCTKTDLTTLDGIELTPTIAIPVAKATFAFQDFIKSTDGIQTGADASVFILQRKDSIATYTLADIVNKATGTITSNVSKNVTIGELSLQEFNLTKNTTLGTFSSAFSEPIKTLFATGGTVPFTSIPAFSQTVNSITPMDDITDFETVSLASGQLQLNVKNNFPFVITNLNVDLLDRGNGNTLITTINIGTLAINETKTLVADLSNKMFSNKLAYRIPTLGCSGIAANTVVSPDATIAITAASSNMKMKSGRVKVPAQTLTTENIITSVSTGDPAQKLHEITVKSATANYTITKNIAVNFNVELEFPNIKEKGVVVKKTIAVNSSSVTGSISFNNAVIDMASKPNEIVIKATASTVASSGFVNIQNTDVINISTNIGSVQVEGAKGQFGLFNITIPKTTQRFDFDFSFLHNSSKPLIFDNPVLKLRYTNSFGIPISANMNITSTGLLNKTPVALSAPVINIAYPKINNLGTEVKDSFQIAKNNSKIVDFLSILPNNIDFDGNIQIKSDDRNEINYFTANSKINMGAEFSLPLKFSTENLILRDTIKSGILAPSESTDRYESAKLVVQHNNSLPLKTTIDIIALTGTTTSSVVENFSIPAATIGADGRVTQAHTGKQNITLNTSQLATLLKSEKLIVVGRLQTATDGKVPVAILSTATFDIGIGMEAKLKIKE